jgi:hypothetical protein
MWVIYGQDIYGSIDRVPGFFRIGTRFYHVYYVPLIPIGTFVVLQQQGKHFRGIQIPLNAKSVMLAYGVGLLAAIWVFAALCTMIVIAAGREGANPYIPGAIAGVSFALWLVFLAISLRQKVSYERACQIGLIAELSTAGWEKLNALYGKAGSGPQM